MSLFFFLCTAYSSPSQDFLLVQQVGAGCEEAVERLLPQRTFLRTQKDQDSYLLAQSLLLLGGHGIDEEILITELEHSKQQSDAQIPPPFVVRACRILQVHPTHEVASRMIASGYSGLWLHPCLPIFTELALTHPEIWSFIVSESKGFPNQNEIRTQLKRKGSTQLLFFMGKLPQMQSSEEISLVHDIIWGLVPPTIPERAHEILHHVQEHGAPVLYAGTHQRVFIQDYLEAIDSLSARFQAHPDARMWMDSAEPTSRTLLRQSLCSFR